MTSPLLGLRKDVATRTTELLRVIEHATSPDSAAPSLDLPHTDLPGLLDRHAFSDVANLITGEIADAARQVVIKRKNGDTTEKIINQHADAILGPSSAATDTLVRQQISRRSMPEVDDPSIREDVICALLALKLALCTEIAGNTPHSCGPADRSAATLRSSNPLPRRRGSCDADDRPT